LQPSLDSPEMKELIAKLAVWPHGLGFLHLASLETLVINLRMPPRVVEAARDLLATAEGRAELIQEVNRVRSLGLGAAVEPPCCRDNPEHPQLTEHELIEAARNHPLGLSFLQEGHPEAVAVIFGVLPSVVFQARELLAHSKPDAQN